MPNLTAEQQAIINHPLDQHARILAVAGSGKTTTMVQRAKHLITNLNQEPRRILVVMFNRMAREDFEQKITREIPEAGRRPKVYTFHGLAYQLWRDAARQKPHLQKSETWFGEQQELGLIYMHRTIDSLLQEGAIEDDVDPYEALDAVALWKASLIPPERAGHRLNPDFPLVYRRFEEMRRQRNAITFDDFIPTALQLFEQDESFRRRWTNKMNHLIVDEYQDINYGQQQFIRALAGSRAAVMVVGDDDQTIYEWRGARPHYILQGFQEDFSNKTVVDYQLPHTFRFGPAAAQMAHNVISFNEKRYVKPLVSHQVQQQTGLTILTDTSEQSIQIARSMGQEIEELVRRQQVQPERIAVLGRTYAQLEGLQTVFVHHKIPFRVVGKWPFFDRTENRTLIDYVRLAQALERHANTLNPWRAAAKIKRDEEDPFPPRHNRAGAAYGEAVRTVLAVANTPSRKLSRLLLQKSIERGASRDLSLRQSLEKLLDAGETPLLPEQRENLEELINFLQRLGERLAQEPDLKAGALLQWIVTHTGYHEHFARYYGVGEASVERMSSVDNFISFATDLNVTIPEFIQYLKTLDPGRGLPDDKVITMTTVHRTKGLEYDYVFIPACIEGNMPVNIADTVGVYDLGRQVPDHPPSPPLESERRLFYVALTRAIKHVYIGAISQAESSEAGQADGLQSSRFLEEIQREPTQAIIDPVQQILSGEAAGPALLKTISRFAGQRQLVRNILNHYLLNKLEPALAGQIRRLLAQTPETPFQYRQQYPELGQSGRRSSAQASPEPPAWSDPWGEIGITI